MELYIKVLFGLFIVLSCDGVALASETSYEEMRRLTLLSDSLIQEIEALRAELRLGGGLHLETERAIQSWVDWARSNFNAGNKRLDLYKTIDVLRDKKLALERLLSVRNGTMDLSGLIVSEEDILPYEDLHNLHIVDGIILSGSQPTESGYRYLKKKGVTTVINWRREDDSEKKMVTDLGLKYYYIPITPAHPPSEKQVGEFLLIIEEVRSKGEKLYHHCLHGVGRCFTANAAYLIISRGMPAEEAIREGKNLANCWPIEQEEKLKEQGFHLGESGLYSFTPQFDFLRNFELLLSRRGLQ
ncbi:MAG TPA: protein-tyrosine phosphatase family protein [Candidatus Tripitaka californicus]|uniref:protein-tyrosine phosphatase family protein n=1 Tax=Candidatus Tripitaka californicus TaxID=3367616 RepID=UPI00402832E8|nr:dual specificity protein phosphatase family protein [Planctomycetota bacterium]